MPGKPYCVSVHVPIGKNRVMFLVCMHRQHGFTVFLPDLASVTHCSNDKAVENSDLRYIISLFMRIAFIEKLLLKKRYVYILIVLVLQKLIQRTVCHGFQRT